MTTYTVRDVADLVGLPAAQIRRYVRRGLLEPARGARGEYRFAFRDLVLLRTARSLRDADIAPRRAFAALMSLRRTLADASALTALRVYADGGRVVVREAEALWNAETGQGHLALRGPDPAGEVAPLRERRRAPDVDDLTSEDWFVLGVELERLDPVRAGVAYEVTLELDPGHVEAHVSLGRLLHTGGRAEEAALHYRRALELDPGHQRAAYHMGVLRDESNDLEAAQHYYARADGVAEAHYRLCRLFELQGDRLSARRHLRRYQRLISERGGDPDR